MVAGLIVNRIQYRGDNLEYGFDPILPYLALDEKAQREVREVEFAAGNS